MPIPDDRMDVQCLLEAFETYYRRKAEHDKARDAYTGYSWGYAGADYIDRMNAAAKEAGDYLDKYMLSKIQENLKELMKEGLM